MIIFPAIDLYKKKAVRLLRGNYDNMTVYSDDPVSVAIDFKRKGATHIHLVDLEGARDGTLPNLAIAAEIAKKTGLFCEFGGGIRTVESAGRCFDEGISRVILGTAAVSDKELTDKISAMFPGKVAVGADLLNGYIAVRGWTQMTDISAEAFFLEMQKRGITNIICTDISRDGAMKGTNRELYRGLAQRYDVSLTASGGVSSLDDVLALSQMGLYGAIIGKAYYTGAVDLTEAIGVAK